MEKFRNMTDEALVKDIYQTYSNFHELLGRMLDEEINFNDLHPTIAEIIPRVASSLRDLLALINIMHEALHGNTNPGLLVYQNEMYNEINRRWDPFGLKDE